MNDPVNNPEHYTIGSVECIEAIRAAVGDDGYEGYLQGNAIKYIWRHNHKGKPLEDLAKAGWYLRRLAELHAEGDVEANTKIMWTTLDDDRAVEIWEKRPWVSEVTGNWITTNIPEDHMYLRETVEGNPIRPKTLPRHGECLEYRVPVE